MVVVKNVLSIGPEPVGGTFGIPGGVAATNVGVHGGETKDASKEAIATIVVGETSASLVEKSETGHCISSAKIKGHSAPSVATASE